MTTAKALRLIRQNKPVTPKQWGDLGIKFTLLGHGVFREAYRIKGTDLVLKAPLGEGRDHKDYSEGIQHSKSEMNRLGRLARIDVLKPYLPTVYYYDPKYGQIVMKYYPPIDEKLKVELLGKVVKSLVSKLAGVVMGDIHEDNIRQKRGDWQVCVFTDLGY
jgi:tRNA A-37 threonylcarbamoyl transferase component Bud32